jgi:DNA-binding XRE family transcriptional regulator
MTTTESVNVSEAAARLGVARQTLYTWERDGKLRRRADGRIAIKEIERMTQEWRTKQEEARTAVQAADYLFAFFKHEEANTRAALVEAMRRGASARTPKEESDAIVAVQEAVDRYRAVALQLWPVVRGAVEGAAELGREVLGTGREAGK